MCKGLSELMWAVHMPRRLGACSCTARSVTLAADLKEPHFGCAHIHMQDDDYEYESHEKPTREQLAAAAEARMGAGASGQQGQQVPTHPLFNGVQVGKGLGQLAGSSPPGFCSRGRLWAEAESRVVTV